jgi:hypothetical protein
VAHRGRARGTRIGDGGSSACSIHMGRVVPSPEDDDIHASFQRCRAPVVQEAEVAVSSSRRRSRPRSARADGVARHHGRPSHPHRTDGVDRRGGTPLPAAAVPR